MRSPPNVFAPFWAVSRGLSSLACHFAAALVQFLAVAAQRMALGEEADHLAGVASVHDGKGLALGAVEKLGRLLGVELRHEEVVLPAQKLPDACGALRIVEGFGVR